jgi:FKBP-type peptidyl-prolyl cis-trans isomerase
MIGRWLPAFILMSFLWLACSNQSTDVVNKNIVSYRDDSVVMMNKQLLKIENQEITDFCNRYRWEMEQTSTGLRYCFIKNGQGKSVTEGTSVDLIIEVRLLTGEIVFKKDPVKFSTVVIGKRQLPAGLEEGILLMKTGDQCKFIIPSYLASGLPGDFENVPDKAVLVCDVELLKVRTTSE